MIPTISGTQSGQNVDSGSTINPFTGVTVTDGNDWLDNTKLTLTLRDDNGNPTGGNGSLSGGGVTEVSPGTYVLTDSQAPSPSRELHFFADSLPNIQFIPSTAATTHISLTILDEYGETATNNGTMIHANGGTSKAAETQSSSSGNNTPDPVMNVSTGDTSSTERSNNNNESNSPITVDNDSQITIDRHSPDTYALVNGDIDIDLYSMARADHYSFRDDMLTLYSASGRSLADVHLAAGSSDFSVEKSGATVSIYTEGASQHVQGNLLWQS